jgi:PAS domain S-box-containing protein
VTFLLSVVTYRRSKGEKQAIEQLTRTKGELEMRITERTADLTKANEDLHTELAERRQVETALRRSEQRYRELFESANDGIFILDETGFVDCNRRGAEMYGRTREEVIGHAPVDFSPERQPNGRRSSEFAEESILKAQRNIPQVFEWQSLRSDGSAFDAEMTLNRFDMAGKVYLQAIVRDITDRKRLEMEISRTQKLESIGALAGGIAHDFNNLLQGVFGYISMAKLNLDREQKSFTLLEEAERALQRSVNLTTQLLTFSRGGKPIRHRIDLRPLIEDTVKFTLSGSKVDYKISADEALWSADADEGQIGQVIQNIVLNAGQAMPMGGTVTIRAENFDMSRKGHPPALNQGNYVVISIKDSGTGIPAEHLQKIFDPYFTTKDKGSGLGLATSYSIIKNHGGVIEVSSERGEGSTFSIWLPAIKAAPDQMRPEKSSATAIRKGRILLMDDEELVRDVAAEMLRTLGHEVELAVDGEEAIDRYQESWQQGRPYDVVILDLTIRSGMGGERAVKSLIKINPDIKAVVSSGYSDSSAISEFKSLGFKTYLAKPYHIDALNDTLNMLLAQR